MKTSIIFISCFLGLFLYNCGNNSSHQETTGEESSIETQNDNSDSEGNVSHKSKAQVVKLNVTNIEDGTPVLGNQSGNSYHAKNMFDDNPATGWAIKLSKTQEESDRIYGPSMNVNATKLDHIIIQNGYGKNRDSFTKNTRAKNILIYRITDDEFPEEEDIIYEGPLKDTMEPQTLKINSRYDNSKPTRMVQITFPHYTKNNYYMGSKWDDLVISELEFYGVPKNSNTAYTSVQTDDFNLMTLINAFKNNLDSGKKNFITKIMEENLGFKFTGNKKTKITLDDPSSGEYQEEAKQYTFKKNDLEIDVIALEYDTHTHITKFVLKFNDKQSLDKFVNLSKEKMGTKFKRYSTSRNNWETKVNRNGIIVNIYEKH